MHWQHDRTCAILSRPGALCVAIWQAIVDSMTVTTTQRKIVTWTLNLVPCNPYQPIPGPALGAIHVWDLRMWLMMLKMYPGFSRTDNVPVPRHEVDNASILLFLESNTVEGIWRMNKAQHHNCQTLRVFQTLTTAVLPLHNAGNNVLVLRNKMLFVPNMADHGPGARVGI